MNPITNSVIKEQMRQRNESMAQSREAQIRSQLTANLNSLSYKSKHNFSPFGIGGGILGIVLAVSGVGFSGILVGLAVGTGVWIAMNQSVKTPMLVLTVKSNAYRTQQTTRFVKNICVQISARSKRLQRMSVM